MPEHQPTAITRRQLLQAGAALAATPLLGRIAPAAAQTPPKGTKVLDFMTGADVAKAEAEGEVVYYSHDGEAGIAALLDAFRKDFPKIKTSYVRAQTGALYAKVTAERSAGRYAVDVLQLSDISPAIDFQKKGGYEQYVSPEHASYKAPYQSTPGGYFTWMGVTFAGISYNNSKVKPEQAPKTWKDMLNPIHKDGMSAKLSTSGMQHMQWYMLRKLYGADFWQEFGKLRPRGFDARAKLFVDWALSNRGQTVNQTNALLIYGSVKNDAPAMATGKKLTDFKLLFPTDWADFQASHSVFVKEWNSLMGL